MGLAAALRKTAAVSAPAQYATPKSFSKEELFNAVRQDVMAELDAINLYEAHKAAGGDAALAKILDHIIADEKHHVYLLETYLKQNKQWDSSVKA